MTVRDIYFYSPYSWQEKGRGRGKQLAQAPTASRGGRAGPQRQISTPVSGTTGRGRPREIGLTAADPLELSLCAGGPAALVFSGSPPTPCRDCDDARYREGETGSEKPRGWSRSPRWTVETPGQGAPT